ncbi:UNVERIFIED_CONTAM: hypothetical protein HDU68_012583 [Siphonaria sp. JEL0065]|nr:hypothetical protein HDU68_012583 [Siphonaria sp. JEL0065]
MFQNLTSKITNSLEKVQLAATQAVHNAEAKIEAIKEHEILKEIQLGDYTLKPLDAVLFAGSDPVATIIKKITLHNVVPELESPFAELWTHAGILVDKTVLPLDCLEEGKMYLYESVFSGTVAGYVYSTILPIDKNVPKGGCHLGPQIRDFEAVVMEGDANVGICPLTQEQRTFIEGKFKENPNLLLDLYKKYEDFGYPMTNLLGVVASASHALYEDLKKFNETAATYIPGHKETTKKTVFCSELVSIIYKELSLPSFIDAHPDTFTPLEVQVVPEFGNNVYYAKENKVSLLKHGNKLSTGMTATKAQKLLKSVALHAEWVKMPPSGGIPPDAEAVGEDIDGQSLYIARVKIGGAYYLGKIGHSWKYPHVTYFNREVPIRFGHEVLKSVQGMHWEDAENGHVPISAVKAGMEEDGSFLHIARGVVGGNAGVLGVGKKEGRVSPGMVAAHLKAAKIPFGGQEVSLKKYQVLCYNTGF